MKIYFRSDGTLVVAPTDTVEAMALKYWEREYATHGDKVFEVSTDIPIALEDRS